MAKQNESNQELAEARERFEQERMTRRSALRKIGVTTSIALFGMFAVDDLARLAVRKLEEHKETRGIAETVAREFKTSGVAFAAAGGLSPTNGCKTCECCVSDKLSRLKACDDSYAGCTATPAECDLAYSTCLRGAYDIYLECCRDLHCNC